MGKLDPIKDRLDPIREAAGETWEGLRQLAGRATHAITRFTHRGRSGQGEELDLRSAGWGLMAAEVFDDGKRIVVRLEAPGMHRDDFDIQVDGESLHVRGEKHLETERSEGRYRIAERAYGRFERVIPLGAPVDGEQTKATYRNGVLRVVLPRLESAEQRRIEVKQG